MSSYLSSIHLKNFRCFKSAQFSLDGPLILIHGLNGSGKTSLLEAFHYVGYLRSFRTRTPRELIHFEAETFFIKATCDDNEITIGCSPAKRQVKINQKAVSSFQELWQFHRIITVTEDDLEIVKGAPEKRRSFIDGALVVQSSQHALLLRTYRNILNNRNALLQKLSINDEELLVWTKKLWETSNLIQKGRKDFLKTLALTCTKLSKKHFSTPYCLKFIYKPKGQQKEDTWESFYSHWKKESFPQEIRYRRTLFGAHLDDIMILFQKNPALRYNA